MTNCSTLLGIFPLVVTTGACSGNRQSLEIAVFGGMLIVSFLSFFFEFIFRSYSLFCYQNGNL
ncbi:MAG: efflux RND transporter permease subunit [cyanobacterium endosymbiont of Rhopalodia sterrenbergii]